MSNLQQQLREFIASKTEEARDLKARLIQIDTEVSALELAPLNRADTLAFALDYIDRLAADHMRGPANWPGQFQRLANPRRYSDPPTEKSGPVTLRDRDMAISGEWSKVFAGSDAQPRFFGAYQFSLSESGACFFFGDVIKAKIEEHFEALYPTVPNPGPPIAERRERIATLQAEAGRIRAQLAEIEGELAGLREVGNSTDADERRQRAERARRLEIERAVYRDFNGSNAAELAQQHGLSLREVQAIGHRSEEPC